MPEYINLKQDYDFLESSHSNLIKEHRRIKRKV